MRIAFVVLTLFHGLIHFYGFIKAFEWFEVENLSSPVSPFLGLIWLLAGILIISSTLLFSLKKPYWWLVAILSVIISQTLVILFWSDVAYATLPNVLIFIISVIAFADLSFYQLFKKEVRLMYANVGWKTPSEPKATALLSVPKPVQHWLNTSGAMRNPVSQSAHLYQEVQIKLKPDHLRWLEGTAEQYVSTIPPSFKWFVRLKVNPFIYISGRDKYDQGIAEMLIKLYSIFTITKARNNKKINQGTLQRYLAEIVWYPSAALSPYIEWEAIDDLSAKATMTFGGISGAGVFYFNDEGQFIRFSAMRYKGAEEASKQLEWVVDALAYQEFSGITIPSKLEATWKLDEGDWTWLKMRITEVEYNLRT